MKQYARFRKAGVAFYATTAAAVLLSFGLPTGDTTIESALPTTYKSVHASATQAPDPLNNRSITLIDYMGEDRTTLREAIQEKQSALKIEAQRQVRAQEAERRKAEEARIAAEAQAQAEAQRQSQAEEDEAARKLEAQKAEEVKKAESIVIAPAPVQTTAPKPPVVAPPAPVVTAAPAVAPAPVVDRYIHVGSSGGQSAVDKCNGPVLFPLESWTYVAEHDFCGGWGRFGSLRTGMKIEMSGLVTGRYTVSQTIVVPKNSSTTELTAFRIAPKVMLQTCIPGTNRMVIVGLN